MHSRFGHVGWGPSSCILEVSMKSFSFAKALVVSSLLGLVLPVACGDSEENPNPNPSDGGEDGGGGQPPGTGAMGGEPAAGGGAALPPGISDMPSTIECGGDCTSASVGLGALQFHIDPCCENDVCGLNTTFLASAGAMFETTCQPKAQPGDVDENCPAPAGAAVPVSDTMTVTLDPFPGCCRPNGLCGVVVNEATTLSGAVPLGDLGLGCVDAAPFFPGDEPVPCGEGIGGAGGANSGGAPPTSAGDGAGGASGGAGGAD